MTQPQREFLPGWRAGLLVLGLYAMLLQAFFGALAGPAHPVFGPDRSALCLSAESADNNRSEPAAPHAGRDCACAALCHAGGALAAGPTPVAFILSHPVPLSAPTAHTHAASGVHRILPPPRGPPRANFVLPV